MKKLNWGIIGSGVIANEMAQALLDVMGRYMRLDIVI